MHQEALNSITFIGTGGGRVVFANQLRSFGGFVINVPGSQIHVDPGPGALSGMTACGLYPTKTRVVFVSHAHIDHANDVNAVIDAMTLGGVNKKGVLISVPSVIEGTKDDSPWLRTFYKSKLGQIVSLKPGNDIKIGDMSFVATNTKHDEEHNIGLKFEYKNLVVGYTSDTAYIKGMGKDYKGSKLLIMNVLRPGSDRWKTHMCTEDAIRLIEEVKPELAVITHFGAKMLKANPLYEARDIQKKTGVRTLAATDGMRISLDSFAGEAPMQTTL